MIGDESAGIRADSRVIYLESERDVERLMREGLVATTNPGAAHLGWQAEYAAVLRGRHVVILPDTDGAGRRLAADVAVCLLGSAATVVIVDLPGHGADRAWTPTSRTCDNKLEPRRSQTDSRQVQLSAAEQHLVDDSRAAHGP